MRRLQSLAYSACHSNMMHLIGDQCRENDFAFMHGITDTSDWSTFPSTDFHLHQLTPEFAVYTSPIEEAGPQHDPNQIPVRLAVALKSIPKDISYPLTLGTGLFGTPYCYQYISEKDEKTIDGFPLHVIEFSLVPCN